MSYSRDVNFAVPHFWNQRFEIEEQHEWLCEFNDILPVLKQQLQQRGTAGQQRALVLGCGNSALSHDLLLSQLASDVVSIDFSSVVIQHMQEKHLNEPRLHWVCHDLRCMDDLASDGFELIIEKGTIDSLISTEKSAWQLTSETEESMSKILSNVSRMLTTGGLFVSITFSQPHFRLQLYGKEAWNWSVEVAEVGREFKYFMYLMRKGDLLNRRELEHFFYPLRGLTSGDGQHQLECGEIDENYLLSLDIFEDGD